MKEKDYLIFRNITLIFILFLVIGIFMLNFKDIISSPQNFSETIDELGIFAPLLVILIVSIEVLIAPIPGVFVSIGAGFAFGAIEGLIYVYIGNLIGNSLAFLLSKRFGRPFAQTLISEKKLRTYDCFLNLKGKYLLWIGYLIPVFPTDLLSFAAGLSKIRYREFLLIISVAFIPNLVILTYFGETIFNEGFSLLTIIFSIFLLMLFLVMFYYFLRFQKKHIKECKIDD